MLFIIIFINFIYMVENTMYFKNGTNEIWTHIFVMQLRYSTGLNYRPYERSAIRTRDATGANHISSMTL